MKTQEKLTLNPPNHISVICRKEDFETSDYMDGWYCALARALKGEGFEDLVVLGDSAQIGLESYHLLEWEEIIDCYDNPKDLQVNLLLI